MSDLPNAPKLGREPVIVSAGGRTFRYTPLSPRAAMRVAFRVAKRIGRPLAELLTGAGIDLGFKEPDTGEELRVTFRVLLAYQGAREALVGKIVEAIAEMDADELGELVDELLVRHLEVAVGPTWVDCSKDGDRIDAEVPDLWALLLLTKAAFSASRKMGST